MAAPLTVSARIMAGLIYRQAAKLPKFSGAQSWRSVLPNGCARQYTRIREVKKFYKNASIATADGWYEINLDKRKLRTPAGSLFRVPSEALALAVATEWNAQEKFVQRHSMHLTHLCNTAIDNPLKVSREDLIKHIVSFLETDTILYRVNDPTELKEMLTAEWGPILQWANERYNISLGFTQGIAIPHINKETKDIIVQHLWSYSDWALFGYEYAVETLRSVILPMALLNHHISVEKAVELATLESIFQAKRWGKVSWHHDMDKYGLQSRLAAATLMVHWCSENTTVRHKSSMPVP